jgi:hypothetical protein
MYRVLLLCCFVLFSCIKQEESIDPIAEPVSISESQRLMFKRITRESLGAKFLFENPDYYMFADDPDHFYLKVDYKFKDFSLEELMEGTDSEGTLDILGSSFVRFFGKIFFSLGGKYNLDLDAVSLEIPFTNIDYDVVKEISMRSAYFEYSERVKKKYGSKANFQWIKNLEISTPWQVPGAKDPLDVLIFSYDDFDNACFYRCVDMKIFTFDIIPFIDNRTHIDLNPNLTVQNLPPGELEFTGHITFLIKVKLPF